MKIAKFAIAGVVVATLLLAAVSYSWTYTPLGRLEYFAAVLAKLAQWNDRPISFAEADRIEANESVRSFMLAAPAMKRVEDFTLQGPGGDLPVRVYWPDFEGPLPVYLDIHGGGWWMGDGFAMEAAVKRLAHNARIIIASVDYRLAPQHPYPAALDDCMVALRWLHDHARELGGDPERLGIGGGSAGGNLAAAVALRARDEGGPLIRFQNLTVPATDLFSTDWPSYEETGDRYMLKVAGIERMIEAYVPDPARRREPHVSPLLAEDLSGLPPAIVVTAHFDPLRDQGIAYAKRLEAAGVPTQLHAEDGGLHGFIGSPERMERAQRITAQAVGAALHAERD